MIRATTLMALALAGAVAQDETEENPEYKAWARQKPGAWVKWSVDSQTGSMKMSNELIWTLKELTADKVVIEEKTVFTAGADKAPTEHTSLITHPAKVKKGTTSDGAKAEQLRDGNEEIAVKGRTIKCKWVEQKLSGKTAGTRKIWRSDEVVGGAVKISMKLDDAAKMTMTMTVVDWKAD